MGIPRTTNTKRITRMLLPRGNTEIVVDWLLPSRWRHDAYQEAALGPPGHGERVPFAHGEGGEVDEVVLAHAVHVQRLCQRVLAEADLVRCGVHLRIAAACRVEWGKGDSFVSDGQHRRQIYSSPSEMLSEVQGNI